MTSGQFHVRPAVRITATYAATDGSMPESIDIVFETKFPTADAIREMVSMLADLPRQRRRDLPGESNHV